MKNAKRMVTTRHVDLENRIKAEFVKMEQMMNVPSLISFKPYHVPSLTAPKHLDFGEMLRLAIQTRRKSHVALAASIKKEIVAMVLQTYVSDQTKNNTPVVTCLIVPKSLATGYPMGIASL